MKLLLVSELDRYARGVNTIAKYVETGASLGHEVAVFGELRSEPPALASSLDVEGFDYVIFVIYQTRDFPDLPYLARLLDGVPKERRVIIDCSGRFNETIRVDHDFNHLEKLDGHQGWEWIEGFQAVSNKILQPTLNPIRDDVRRFLFHGFDASAVQRQYNSAEEAVRTWAEGDDSEKPYNMVYVGNNWQRWTQVKPFLEALEPIKERLEPICFAGWDWDQRPEWAEQLGLKGADVDPDVMQRAGVEAHWAIQYDDVVNFLSQGRIAPIFHRPIYNELQLVTNRTFETFCADVIPLLMIPEDVVVSIYGDHALELMPGNDVQGRVLDMLDRPQHYWEIVLEARRHLAKHHSFERRFEELLALVAN